MPRQLGEAADGEAAASLWKDKGRHMDSQEGRKRKIDKNSPEYLWKSLVAGGIAGCAVCICLEPTSNERRPFMET